MERKRKKRVWWKETETETQFDNVQEGKKREEKKREKITSRYRDTRLTVKKMIFTQPVCDSKEKKEKKRKKVYIYICMCVTSLTI